MLTLTHKSPRGKGKQIFGQKEIKNYFPRKRKALQEAGKGGSAERFCEEEKGKCLKFSRNRDSQFIWRARDWVPSRPANDLGEEEEEDNEDSVKHLATWVDWFISMSNVQLFQKRFSCGGVVGGNRRRILKVFFLVVEVPRDQSFPGPPKQNPKKSD